MEAFDNCKECFEQLTIKDEEAVGLDGHQVGELCIREVDDSLQNNFMVFYKGKRVNSVDVKYIVFGQTDIDFKIMAGEL